jgi:hypothetical protein
MGLFDFIGDAFGAITAPFTAVIDAGTKLLGLPPVIGDALKIAVGAATGDFVTLMQGSAQLLKDLAASPAETEYAPPKDEAYGGTDGWATHRLPPGERRGDVPSGVDDTEGDAVSGAVTDPVLVGPSDGEDPEEKRALETLARNFDALNRDHDFLGAFGDKVITEEGAAGDGRGPERPDRRQARRPVRPRPSGPPGPAVAPRGTAVTRASRAPTSISLASRRPEHPSRSRTHRGTTGSMAFPRRRARATRRSSERSIRCPATLTR